MLIESPHSLHYPIRVTALLSPANESVVRFAPLFSYTYKHTVTEGNKYGDKVQVERTFPAEFQSETDGKVLEWKIKRDDVIHGPGIQLVEIEEPCTHEIQFGGLCTNCGKDMSLVNYNTTLRDSDRATINMNHSNTNLKISGDEASRLYEVSTRRLLANKKLTLVVDLDMTIIHATVDPTVADWQKDETNPNHKAVKDVQVFQLMDEGPGSRVCSYYIKMRPGLKDFLEDISQKYELHVYTMGTRSYAQNVCKIVDPDEKIFGDRILSRDENGNLLKKNLRRLFPIDSKMVAIIDDRSDVWDWSPYLLRVTPFDFFVGTGDINGSFLSNRVDLIQSANSPIVPDVPSDEADTEIESSGENGEVKPDPISSPTIEEQLLAMASSSNAATLEEQGHKQQEVLTAQLEDRPLLKKQELLDKQDEEASKEYANGNGSNVPIAAAPRHNLLVDDDTELEFLQMHLERLHHAFFTEYEKSLAGSQGGRVAELRGEGRSKKRPTDDWSLVPDIKDIMPPMKFEVLQGVVICFTGVIPQNTDHQSSDLGMWTRSFGAILSPNLSKSTTHVIAYKDRRTNKVRQAAKHPHIKIVTLNWLFECFARWVHADEQPYLIEVDDDNRPAEDLPGVDLGIAYQLSDDEDGIHDEGHHIDGNEPPVSPIEDIIPGEGDWGDMDAELKEFMGSDTEDSEDDGNNSDASNGSLYSTEKKRKRESSDDEGDTEETDGVNGHPDSKLQRRKKRAMERTSSLTQVVVTAEQPSGLPSPETTGPEEEEGDVGTAAKLKQQDSEDAAAAGEDEDDEAAMERAMLAEFAREDD